MNSSKARSFNTVKQNQQQQMSKMGHKQRSRDVSPISVNRNGSRQNSQLSNPTGSIRNMSKSQVYSKINNNNNYNKQSQQLYPQKVPNSFNKVNKSQAAIMRSEEYKKKLSNCKKLVHQIEYQVFSNSRVKIVKKCRICDIEIDNPNICAYCTIFFCNNCQFYCQQIQEQCPVRCEFWKKQEELRDVKQKLQENNKGSKKNSKNSQHTQPDSSNNIDSLDKEKAKKQVVAQAKVLKKKINRKLVAHKYREFISKQKQTQLVFSSLQNIGDSQSEDEDEGEQKEQKKRQNNSILCDSEGDMEDHLDIQSKESIMLDEEDNQSLQENDKQVIELHSLGEILQNKELSFQPKKKSSKSEEREKKSLIQLLEDPQYEMNLQFIREQIYEESQSNCYQVNGSYQESQKFLKEKISENKKQVQGCCKVSCNIF
ncbi:hypothetical protein PPERSA_04379 [Pseudocohnilembus persalinus]|uniref:Uncharacterized protein n=1 Tax=Pseudocohnilembus persalinus TaxID=266149 RepID=A0A0V0QQM8_PSEPJ|nr:hypothetical protein PPERSA_04379 [Pseudocohnilembus persalinus]|eukprot:KRX04564.1 hypothetical protein PPERSA_04379 [Pseudocohnilembus persalinus]